MRLCIVSIYRSLPYPTTTRRVDCMLPLRVVGVVPILCEELFKGIDAKKKSGDPTEYEVSVVLS